MLTDADWRALERFVRADALARQAWEELREIGALLIPGSGGEVKANPLVRIALGAETHAARFAAELGLSRRPPAARPKMVERNTRAPDRTAAPAKFPRIGKAA